MHAFRHLTKSPGFTLVAVLTLALCIGANSAIFSAVHGILLKPYPWSESDRLVYCYNTYTRMGLPQAGISIPDYIDRKAGVREFEDAALFHSRDYNLTGLGTPERVAALRATASLFSTLHTAPVRGRVFSAEECEQGRDRVVVLSDALWRTRFGARDDVLGHTIQLEGEAYTVIGIMPADFQFPNRRIQLWVPFAFTAAQRSDSERGTEYSTMIARLAPTATLASAQASIDRIEAQITERLPQRRDFIESSGFGGRVAGFHNQNVSNIRGMLWLLQAGVAAALLIGCANVTNLLLARAVTREHELAIRSALGAPRGRLARMLLSEILALFLAGGAFGLLVALWGIRALNAVGLAAMPRGSEVRLDFAVFGFTFACAVVCGLLFGALPAWSATKGNAAAVLKDAGTRSTSSRRTQRLRSALVIVEIGLAVMLLLTAGLLIKGFARLQSESPGFDPTNVLTAQLNLSASAYTEPRKQAAFFDRVVEQLRGVQGVKSVAIATTLPFSGSTWSGNYGIDGYTPHAGQPAPHAERRSVSPEYFKAMGIPLLRGRGFSSADGPNAPGVVIIDRVLADRYWPGEDPIGHVIIGGDGPGRRRWTIVGVVAEVRNYDLETAPTKESLYYPIAQSPQRYAMLVVKSESAPATLLPAVRNAVAAVDPEQPLFDVRTMSARIEQSLVTRRAPMLLLTLFSTVSVLLATLGVYGVLAFTVSQRAQEIGVRMALGATPGDIARLVLRDGTRLIIIGIVAGLAGYLGLSHLIAKLLYGVSASDPVTLVTAPLILVAVALLACLIPTARAVRIEPASALRSE